MILVGNRKVVWEGRAGDRSPYPDPMIPTPFRHAFLAAEICSVLRFAYPAGKVSEAIRRTMLPNNRRVRWLSASISQ